MFATEIHASVDHAVAVTAVHTDAIRPFHVHFPEAALADLRQRLAQTRLPESETVTDHSQGVPLKTVQQVLRYWQTDYDWRKVEARLNAVPNFITEIDGLRVRLNVSLPGVEQEVARALMDKAHQTCAYSEATRGNIDVAYTLI
jgi:hypothetical protein